MHVNTLYNLAVMFDTHCKRKREAEKLYRIALHEEPDHIFALYNLAVLLEERLDLDPSMNTRNTSRAFTSITDTKHTADVGILDPSSLMRNLNDDINEKKLNAFNESEITNESHGFKDSEKDREREALIKEVSSLHERSMLLSPSDVATIADYGRYVRTYFIPVHSILIEVLHNFILNDTLYFRIKNKLHLGLC